MDPPADVRSGNADPFASSRSQAESESTLDCNGVNASGGAVASQGGKRTCVPEGPDVPETSPAGSGTIARGRYDSGSDPTADPDESRSHDLRRVSNTMGGIPGAESEPERIRRIVYSADTIPRDSVRDGVPGITETGNNISAGARSMTKNNFITEGAEAKLRARVGRVTSPGRDDVIGEASSGSGGPGRGGATVHGTSAGPVDPPDSHTVSSAEMSGIPGNSDSSPTTRGQSGPVRNANSEVSYIVLDSTGDGTNSVLSTIKDGTGSVLGTIEDGTDSVFRTIDDTGSALSTLDDGTGSVLGTIEDSTCSVLGTIEDSTCSVLGTIEDSTCSVLGTIENGTGPVLSTIKDSIGSIFSTIDDDTGSLLSTVDDGTGSVLSTSSVLSIIKVGTGSVLSTVDDGTGPVFSTIEGSTGSVFRTIDDTGSALSTLDDGTGSVLGTIENGTGPVLSTIKDSIGSILSTIDDSTGSVLSTVDDGTGPVFSTIEGSTGSVLSTSSVLSIIKVGTGSVLSTVDDGTGPVLSTIEYRAGPVFSTFGSENPEHSRNFSLVPHPDSNSDGMLMDAVPVHHGSSTIHCGDSEPLENILEDPGEMFDPGVSPDILNLSGIARTHVGSGSGVLEDPTVDVTRDHGIQNKSSVTHTSSRGPAWSLGDPPEETQLTCTDELWVDACAFLPCEVLTGVIVEECGYCPVSCPPTATPSGPPQERGTTSGLLELPPIQRWSSSESWASALSDLVQSISAPLEEEAQGGSLAGRSGGPELQAVGELSSSRSREPGNYDTSPAEDSATPWELVGDLREDGGRNGGVLSLSGYSASAPPRRPAGHESDSGHLTRPDSDSLRNCFPSPQNSGVALVDRTPGDSDSIMLLAPVALGESFLRSAEERHESRTSLNRSQSRTGEIGFGYAEFLDASFFTLSTLEEPGTQPHPGDPSSEILPASNRLAISEEKRVACITLDLNDVLGFGRDTEDHRGRQGNQEMPHRSTKSSKNKDRASQSRKQEDERPEAPESESGVSEEGAVTLMETIIIKEKVAPKAHAKKKKKHGTTKTKEAGPDLGANLPNKPDTETSPGQDPGLGSGRRPDSGLGSGSGRRPGSGPGSGLGQGPDSGLGPGPGLGSGSGRSLGSGPGSGLGPGPRPGLGPGLGPGLNPNSGPGLGQGPGPDSGLGPGPGLGSGLGPNLCLGRGSGSGPGPGSGSGLGPRRGPGSSQGLGRVSGSGQGLGQGSGLGRGSGSGPGPRPGPDLGPGPGSSQGPGQGSGLGRGSGPGPGLTPDTKHPEEPPSSKPEPAEEVKSTRPPGPPSTSVPGAQDDDVKRRRISAERGVAVQVRVRPQLPAIFRQRKEEEVEKQKVQAPAEVPQVLTEIAAAPVVDAPQNILLWCTFSSVSPESTITWMKEETLLSEDKKVGDDGRVTLLVVKASSKDLGLYRCTVSASHGSVSTPDYHLTSEVLMELVIPDHDAPGECRRLDGEEEDISYAPLLFKDDILSHQYFGERQHTSIVTEKDHFGEGMHRKAFRTTVCAGATPSFNPGHTCVLKVHNSIGYGAKDNDELVQKNYNLAVEECYVQNTAREYIKAYNDVAKSADSFGEVPEIIPIFLVHRPSNAIPYATLEEELMGDFVKYSVKDGKEINLKRNDSEAGQKCCAFQHWVYAQTEGNLLVTDMQGVGMKLTDVGIATCKKGYKGFKGNCSTSFIDQFKALHQCNRFCELLGLASLQPKPRRTTPAKPKAPPGAKKKLFSPTLKGKS